MGNIGGNGGGRRGREDQEPQGQTTSRHGWGILEGMAGIEEAGKTKSLKDRQHQGMDGKYWSEWRG